MREQIRILLLFLGLVLVWGLWSYGQRLLAEEYLQNWSARWEEFRVKWDESNLANEPKLGELTVKIDQETKAEDELLGKARVLLVLVSSGDTSEEDFLPLVRKLKDPRDDIYIDCYDDFCRENASVYYMERFISEQAQMHGAQVELELDVVGPFGLENLTYVGDPVQIWGKDPFGGIKLRDDFDTVLVENGISANEFDVVEFLYFDESFEEVSGETIYSFYEQKKFRSFANQDWGKAYINVYDFDPRGAISVVEVVAHEFLHLFGAVDTYYEGVAGCTDEGRGDYTDLDSSGSDVSAKADIMCLFVRNPSGEFRRAHFADGNLVINKFTAEKVGWR